MMKKTLFFALFIALAPVTLLADSSQPAKKPSNYVVKTGDCLWNISKNTLGDPLKWPIIYVANQGKIQNPNLIYSGQKFTIPATFTKEELKKASQLAEEKAAPIGVVRLTGAEDTQLTSQKKHKTASPSEEVASLSIASKETSAAPKKAANSPAIVQENQPAGAPESSGGPGKMIALLLALVALVGGVFLWMRSRRGPTANLQAPRPLSSFPPAGEQGQRPSTPFSTSQAYPAPKPVVTTPPPNPSLAPSEPKVEKPATYSGTMTSVSTPSSPASSVPPVSKPAEPAATQLPLTPPTPAPSEAQASPSTPAHQTPEENKPSDTPPTSSSSNHAA